MSDGTLIVIAKQPIAGRVKTRLVPPLTYDEAARLAAAALLDTLDAVDRTPVRHRLLAFDGDARKWRAPGWRTAAQPEGGLDERIVAAFAAAPRGPALLIGMDTPQLHTAQLQTFDPRRYDACLGPTHDGGYWVLGFADPRRHARAAVLGVPMSTACTGAIQLERLHRRGLRVQMLATLTDVDTIDAAVEVARVAPYTRFAATLASIEVRV